MQTRRQGGQYASHNTPGDGTGRSGIRERDALDFMGDDDATENTAQVVAYDCRERHGAARKGK